MAGDVLLIVAIVGSFGATWAAAVATALAFVALTESAGLYRSRLQPSVLNDMSALSGRLLISGTIVYALSDQGTGTISPLGDDLGRIWWWSIAGSILSVIAFRAVANEIVRTARRRGWVNHRTLIVGAGEIGSDLASRLSEHPEYGLKPIGFHDPFPPATSRLPLPVFTSSLDRTISDLQASVVILTPVAIPDSQLVELVRSRHRDYFEIYFVPSLYQLNSGAGREIERVRSIPVIRLRRSAHRSAMWTIKAVFDRVLAGLILLLLSPLLLTLAALVAIFIGRPVLFRQQRVGLDGVPFEILKFRSLPVVDAGESDTAWAAQTTRQPTLLGRLLRELSLDELPQLWNILRGEMSFVGPRPERPHFVGTFSTTYSDYSSRHRVHSGLTGLAQVNGLRGDTSIAERAAFDNMYVETWSLGEDLKIIIRTLGSIIRRSGG
jgi:exopolysaccharide biosynthesis polyprenyl glycosylphosphotransferase